MQRRTSQLLYTTAVTLFMLSLVALMAFFAAAASPVTPATKVSAHGLYSPLTSALVINEVYRSSTLLNEYVELYNGSSSPITLTGYTLYNNDTVASSGVTGTVSLSLLQPSSLQTIRPGQYLVITPQELGRSTLIGNGLDPAGDYLALKRNDCEICAVDLVNWGIDPLPSWNEFNTFTRFFFHPPNIPSMPTQAENSLSRYPDHVDTDSGSDWQALPRSAGYANTLPAATLTPTGTALTVTPSATVGCEDVYEPDNGRSQAKELLPGVDQTHTFCRNAGSTKDVDWVRFGAAAGKQYTMLTKDLTDPVDTIITLFDSSGNQLAQNDDYLAGSLASEISYTFSVADTYYLQITDARANGGLGYQYKVSLIQEGIAGPTTTPTSNVSPTPTSGPCYDAYEPDGLPETAKTILIGSTQNHSICPTGDADWVRFYARAGKVYTIRTSNLGMGLDTFIILFAGDAKTILAQNDDGGDPANPVASRIDFYPQKDDWYFAQIKDAGDIGGSDLTYDLSLAVVPGVPQPPGTATAIIAPQITATAVATLPPPGPTRPPVPTPTVGSVPPTPTPQPTTQLEAAPVQTVLALSGGEVNASSGKNVLIPNVPRTGIDPNGPKSTKKVSAAVAPPLKSQGSPAYAPVLFRIFYDRNRDETFDPSEGIRGLKVYFLNAAVGMMMSGQLVTSDIGTGNATLPVVPQRIYIPYLGVNVALTRFPERETHSLWLQPVQLPGKVP